MLWQLFHLHFEFGFDEALIFMFLVFPGFLLGKLLKHHKKEFTFISVLLVFILELLTCSRQIMWALFHYEHWILYRLNFLGYIMECAIIPFMLGLLLSWVPLKSCKKE